MDRKKGNPVTPDEIVDAVGANKITIVEAYQALLTELRHKEIRMYNEIILPFANKLLEESMRNAEGGDCRFEEAFQFGINELLDGIYGLVHKKEKIVAV